MGRGQGLNMSMEHDGLSVIVGTWQLDWGGVNVTIGMRYSWDVAVQMQ